MNLSDHFTLKELTETSKPFPNAPNDAQLFELTRLCATMLEPIRSLLAVPIGIDSGFRSLAVNNAIPGSAHNSQHMLGQAADIVPQGLNLEDCFQKIKASGLPFDQLIREPTWLHVSIAAVGATPRRQTLRMHRDSVGKPHYEVA